MSSMTEGLLGELQGQPLDQISQKLGLSSAQTSTALAAALPLLLGALGRNARQPEGASSLFGALERDHVGLEPTNALGSALGGGGQGGQILGHIFGAQEPVAAQGLGAATGLPPDRANMLLRWLAPVAMAYLAKRMFDRRQERQVAPQPGSGSVATPQPSPGELGRVLEHEEAQITQQGGIGGQLLGAVFDRNRDGKVDFSDLLAGLNGGRA